eukprot:TRINITY_DN5261_c0_g1_i2.p1 TRINITY_DN5261_c0_g1~~TRINITY_DN5261_c0_g1_i2.p1  ORF type:complete len:202 (+),score=24.78 TRINITY_DN5261_c0_g1_i2:139-744(+)
MNVQGALVIETEEVIEPAVAVRIPTINDYGEENSKHITVHEVPFHRWLPKEQEWPPPKTAYNDQYEWCAMLNKEASVTQSTYSGTLSKTKLTRPRLRTPTVPLVRDVFIELRSMCDIGVGTFSDDELASCSDDKFKRNEFLFKLGRVIADALDQPSLMNGLDLTRVGADPIFLNRVLQVLHEAALAVEQKYRTLSLHVDDE